MILSFSSSSWDRLAGLILLTSFSCTPASPLITVSENSAKDFSAPVSVRIDLAQIPGSPSPASRFQLKSPASAESSPDDSWPAQFEPDTPGSTQGKLWWIMPSLEKVPQQFALTARSPETSALMQVLRNPSSGYYEIIDSSHPVLRYNYLTIEPGELLAKVHPDNLKYARARSDYIHPLFGLDGEELTKDWPVDHPHHRGIYWAWPEVDFLQERGDLHALQRVFARPTGAVKSQEGPLFARLEAENLWRWEDQEPIVRERTIIRAWRTGKAGRLIDLEFEFKALKDGITLARRETDKYGGLNIRLASVVNQQIEFHTDPSTGMPRRAWAELSGSFAGNQQITALAVFQNPLNPEYPGDWIKYPEINWFQPTFPSAGTRYPLKKDQLLVLRYRLWIHQGKASEASLSQGWLSYVHHPQIKITY